MYAVTEHIERSVSIEQNRIQDLPNHSAPSDVACRIVGSGGCMRLQRTGDKGTQQKRHITKTQKPDTWPIYDFSLLGGVLAILGAIHPPVQSRVTNDYELNT
jgi:hypothetical protein